MMTCWQVVFVYETGMTLTEESNFVLFCAFEGEEKKGAGLSKPEEQKKARGDRFLVYCNCCNLDLVRPRVLVIDHHMCV